MHSKITIALLSATVLSAVGSAHAQITDPIPEPITKRGLNIEIREVAELPDTRGTHPVVESSPSGRARVSFVQDLPDGRRFANDSAPARRLDRQEHSAQGRMAPDGRPPMELKWG